MKNLIIISLIVMLASTLSAEKRKAIKRYTDLDGIVYTMYEGENIWEVSDADKPNANPLLIDNVKPGVNLHIDEGTIAIEMWDHSGMFGSKGMTEDQTAKIADDPEINSFSITPNPPGDNLNISFDLFDENDVEILVYDYTGKVIRPLLTQRFSPGHQEISIPTKDLNADKYYVTFKVGNKKITKMVYMD
jgi:hypothetical protein